MFQSLKDFLHGLLYEGGVPCIPHIIALAGYAAFLIASGFLMYHNMQWADYTTFASLTAGGGTLSVVGNKLINSICNSAPGQMPNTTTPVAGGK